MFNCVTVVIFDTETTGLTLPTVSPLGEQPRIIEIGMQKVDVYSDGSVIKTGVIDQKIDPEEGLSVEINKITGLSDDDLKGCPTFKEFAPQLDIFLDGVDVLIAHNAPFDVNMIKNEEKRCGVEIDLPHKIVCSAQEIAPIMGWRPSLKDFYKHATGKELVQTHRALDDVNALLEALIASEMLGAICDLST